MLPLFSTVKYYPELKRFFNYIVSKWLCKSGKRDREKSALLQIPDQVHWKCSLICPVCTWALWPLFRAGCAGSWVPAVPHCCSYISIMPLDHGPMVNFGHVPLMTSTWMRQKVVPRGEGASPREAWLQFNHWMFEGSSLSCGTFIHEVPSFSSAHPCFTGWDKALGFGWGQGDVASSEGSAPPPAATSSSRYSPSTPEVLRFIFWTTPGCRRIFLFYSFSCWMDVHKAEKTNKNKICSSSNTPFIFFWMQRSELPPCLWNENKAFCRFLFSFFLLFLSVVIFFLNGS